MSVPAFNQPVVNLPNDAMRHEAEANTTGAAASAAVPAAKAVPAATRSDLFKAQP